jgi:hypothetical protein
MSNAGDLAAFQARWHGYYTDKRIVHQWTQAWLLKDLGVRKVLEVGPYLGLVTAMLASAGYEVTTFDVDPANRRLGARDHIVGDLRQLDPARIGGHDVILCCETLEHLHWPDVDGVLRAFSASGNPYLVMSVPYEGFQMNFTMYLNRFVFRRRFSLRKLRFLQRFRISDDHDFDAHKWEVGYRGTSLDALKDKLRANGWEPVRQHFTGDCRSVFMVCRNKTSRAQLGGAA